MVLDHDNHFRWQEQSIFAGDGFPIVIFLVNFLFVSFHTWNRHERTINVSASLLYTHWINSKRNINQKLDIAADRDWWTSAYLNQARRGTSSIRSVRFVSITLSRRWSCYMRMTDRNHRCTRYPCLSKDHRPAVSLHCTVALIFKNTGPESTGRLSGDIRSNKIGGWDPRESLRIEYNFPSSQSFVMS